MENHVSYFNGFGNYGLHSHTKDEIVIIKHGKFTITTEKETFTQNAPCVILYKKNRIHIQHNIYIGKYERYCIQFNKSNVLNKDAYNNLFVYSPSDVIFIPLDLKSIQPLWLGANTLHLYREKNKTSYRYLLSFIVSEIYHLYKEHCSDNNILQTSEPYLSNVMQYVCSHLSEKITIDSIAEKFNVSRTKIINDFRKYLLTTFSDYVTVQRLNKSCELLERGLKANEIAEACGFGDASYFVKVFKKYFDTTPNKYRKTFT